MRRADHLQIRGSTRGLTLLELAVVLAIIGFVAAGSMAMLTASIQSSQYNTTVARMQAIEAALLNFRVAFTRLPCPGDLTIVPTNATTGTYYNSTEGEDYGLEAGADAKSAIATATGACTGANMTPQANFTATGNEAGTNVATFSYTVAEGAVPTRALRLPDSYMYDGWGNKFRYAVDVAYTATGDFTTYLPTADACAYGGITIKDSTGANRSSASIYALISHGANGHGAYTNNGTIINGGSSNANELANCSCNSSGSAATFAPTFVQQLPATTTVGNGLPVFDDIVDYRERWQMQAPTGDTPLVCFGVYVQDYGSTEYFTNTGAYVGSFSAPYYANPAFIRSDSGGSLWMSAPYTWIVFKVNLFGSTLVRIPSGGASCSVAAGSLCAPGGLSLDASGSVWNFDSGNNRVQKFNNAGSWISMFPTGAGCGNASPPYCTDSVGNGSFGDYAGGNDGIAIDGNGSIWVGDGCNNRVEKFNSTGTWQLSIPPARTSRLHQCLDPCLHGRPERWKLLQRRHARHCR